MSQRNSSANSSPVTRPLHGARVSSKALSRSAKLSSSSRSAMIPNPARPAHANRTSAHIVSFADAKRSNQNARIQALGDVPMEGVFEEAAVAQAMRAPMSAEPQIRGNHVSSDLSEIPRGAHASMNMGKRRMPAKNASANRGAAKKSAAKKSEASHKKRFKLPELPFGKKNGKEFVIPSGADLTTDSTNIFRNMPSRSGNVVARNIARSQALSAQMGSSEAMDEAAIEEKPSKMQFASNITGFIGNRSEARAEKKRKKAKAKADKKFNKTYGASSKEGAGAEAGPRAALYSTKMGKSHKKSAKMQIKDVREMASHSMGVIGDKISGFSLPELPKFVTRLMTAASIVAIFGFGLYGPAQQYYIQMRETDRLEAELVEVADRTNNLAASIESLHTTEGIEDKAHSDLGYVKYGEKSATVKGIAQINLLSLPTSNVAPGSIPAPDTWYSGALDVLFGYIS